MIQILRKIEALCNRWWDTKLYPCARIVITLMHYVNSIAQIFGFTYLYRATLHLSIMYLRYFGTLSDYARKRTEGLTSFLRHNRNKKNSLCYASISFEVISGSNRRAECLKILEETLSQEDPKAVSGLREIFYQRNIVIVGPSPSATKINFQDYDICVTANTLPPLVRGLCPSKIARFVNIGYMLRNRNQLVNEVDSYLAIFVKPGLPIENPFRAATRYFISPTRLMYNDYGPMGLQNLLYSVLAGQCKKVYVTGFTGYIGGQAYADGVKSYSSEEYQYILSQIRRHEPMSNFNFVKKILELGLCDGDALFKDVFSMSPVDYAAELGKQYKNYSYRASFPGLKHGL